jgi:hypothetical protein
VTAAFVELRMDLFPARVVVNPDQGTDAGEEIFEITRLLVGLDEIWVWAMVAGAPALVLNERYEDISGRRTIGWTATLGDGRTAYFKRASGCGCGNPLRGWQPPFMTVQGASTLQ